MPPPPRPDTPPVVLILGGTTTVARALALYLVGGDEKLASFVRIEYKQINLSSKERHAEVFTPPQQWAGGSISWERGFDVVFDLTGEIGYDKPELMRRPDERGSDAEEFSAGELDTALSRIESTGLSSAPALAAGQCQHEYCIQISNTYQLALTLASSAASLGALKPRAYIRLTFPFYEMKSLPSSSRGHGEDAELRPDGARGRWWHEVLRGLGRVASAEGLNVGVIRCGAWYGRGTWEGEVIPRVVAGHVYSYLKEDMKFLYNSDLRINTVHTADLSQALYLASLHLLSTDRAKVISQSGVSIPYTWVPPSTSPFSLGKDKRTSLSDLYKTVKTIVPEQEKVVLPMWNVVDEGDSTQEKLGRAVADVWGIKYGFLNSTVATLVQQFAKSDFSEMVEDVNEMHVEAWSKMLAGSSPPIASTPITPFLDEHAFRKLAICLDGSKARQQLGFKARFPNVKVGELKEIVKGFQDDGLWPKLS
ncbi:hypothetical protein JCM24511_00981 [Saitozyma sp. JCM 24511]|nr:hypothetical protein JCM24511_00981 [Saitozyma sp. JCM 24511]